MNLTIFSIFSALCLATICPNMKSLCPHQSTCCPLKHNCEIHETLDSCTSDEDCSWSIESDSCSGDEYGCCPYVDGICCKDGGHCCKSGYSCVDLTSISWLTGGENPVRCRLPFKSFLSPLFWRDGNIERHYQ